MRNCSAFKEDGFHEFLVLRNRRLPYENTDILLFIVFESAGFVNTKPPTGKVCRNSFTLFQAP